MDATSAMFGAGAPARTTTPTPTRETFTVLSPRNTPPLTSVETIGFGKITTSILLLVVRPAWIVAGGPTVTETGLPLSFSNWPPIAFAASAGAPAEYTETSAAFAKPAPPATT